MEPRDAQTIIDAVAGNLPACRFETQILVNDSRGIEWWGHQFDDLEESGVLILDDKADHKVYSAIAPCQRCGWSGKYGWVDHDEYTRDNPEYGPHYYEWPNPPEDDDLGAHDMVPFH